MRSIIRAGTEIDYDKLSHKMQSCTLVEFIEILCEQIHLKYERSLTLIRRISVVRLRKRGR